MKIDMSAAAVTRRLETASRLRRLCLALADSSAARDIAKKHPHNHTVQRTMRAIGRLHEHNQDNPTTKQHTP